MKKWICTLLALLLLLPALASAEDAVSFNFRNGITWASSPQDVRQSEAGQGDEDTQEDWFGISYYDVSVSNYTADQLVYIFSGENLMSVWYAFAPDYRSGEPALEESDCIYLKNALVSKYGEPETPDKSRLVTLLNAIDPINSDDVFDLTNWTLDDGTYIAVFAFDDVDVYQYILYFNEKSMLMAAGIYNTSGL